jgi:hypothetical protein
MPTCSPSQKQLETAALLNSTIISGYFVDKMTATIENEKKLSHEKVRRFAWFSKKRVACR